ncbi:MAG: serine/threonine-protein kinase, partial [Myxococcales bacterium]|nr:serine/threonine protein kinase [Polyangiaceae bacterium]MDW8249022.1 serine/threonine-protein kinase [Myxococcales bacterium]
MSELLRANDDDLRDLSDGHPELVAEGSQRPARLTLMRCLGVGGMSTVFLAEVNSLSLPNVDHPSQLAIKITRPSTARQLASMGFDPLALAVREATALGRIMARRPPTPFVIHFYGTGSVRVLLHGGSEVLLPWLALEFVEGGSEGITLTQRVRRATGGIDPSRALRLTMGILEGVQVLHEEGIIHRDLKPDNVLLRGPVDDETPKIADCGIARVQGLEGGTLAAMTPAYGGPEQVLSLFRPGARNPLIGPWTDVHALAAVIWFLLTGEDWCRGEHDGPWHGGQRRSLLTAQRRLHPGFAAHTELLARLDQVLQRGASHRLPEWVWENSDAIEYKPLARLRFAGSMFSGPERYPDVSSFSQSLLPLLSELAGLQRQGVVAPLRSTALLPSSRVEVALWSYREEPPPDKPLCISPGSALVQPDGRVLVHSGDQLLYLVRRKAYAIAVPVSWRETVACSRWLLRAPVGGYALIGSRSALWLRGGKFSLLPLPESLAGAACEVVAAFSGAGRLGLLTKGRDGAPWELWSSRDGTTWGSEALVFEGIPHVIGEGPGGLLVLGHL